MRAAQRIVKPHLACRRGRNCSIWTCPARRSPGAKRRDVGFNYLLDETANHSPMGNGGLRCAALFVTRRSLAAPLPGEPSDHNDIFRIAEVDPQRQCRRHSAARSCSLASQRATMSDIAQVWSCAARWPECHNGGCEQTPMVRHAAGNDARTHVRQAS